MLYSQQEIQAMLALLNRTPMSPAELLYSQNFFQRLASFCTPPPAPACATADRCAPADRPKPEPEPEPAVDVPDKENRGNE